MKTTKFTTFEVLELSDQYEMIKKDNVVSCIIEDPREEKYCFIHKLKHPVFKKVFEIPNGTIKSIENPEEKILKIVSEQLEIADDNISMPTPLDFYYTNSAWTTEKVFIYHAFVEQNMVPTAKWLTLKDAIKQKDPKFNAGIVHLI